MSGHNPPPPGWDPGPQWPQAPQQQPQQPPQPPPPPYGPPPGGPGYGPGPGPAGPPPQGPGYAGPPSYGPGPGSGPGFDPGFGPPPGPPSFGPGPGTTGPGMTGPGTSGFTGMSGPGAGHGAGHGAPPPPPRRGLKRFGNWISVVAAGTVATVVAMIIVINMDDEKAEDEQRQAAGAATSPPPAVMPALPSHGAPTTDPRATASASLGASTAPQTPNAPPAPQQNGRFVAKPDDMSTWPDACALLTPDDIKKVIPGTTNVSQLGTAEAVGYYKDRGPALRSTICEMNVETSRQFSTYSQVKVSVKIRDINPPATIKERYALGEGSAKRVATDYKDLGTTTGADDSYWATSNLLLLKGQYFIEIFASGSLTTESGDLWGFSAWAPQLIPQLAKSVTARI